MKIEGDKLQMCLRAQLESVTLIDETGRERRGMSARFVADYIADGAFIGYSKDGVVSCVKALEAPRCGPFSTKHDVAALMSDFPRLPAIQKNKQRSRAKKWVQQPAFSNTGQSSAVSTVHFG